MSEEISIHDRLLLLEAEINNIKAGKYEKNNDNNKPIIKEKKEKKPREATEYNKFVKEYMKEQKDLLKENYKHKEVFKEAAKIWNEKKEKKNNKIIK